ncbi:Heat shock protein Hsp20 [Macrophomina phaseolina MS6]|uniref:Heat shock protein Hsp20 n=1 Tax=Macrophomina phaseolina (strain MS6) TaxID=1126212 RepID=K2SN19_MACPH|nr:Heat shock protein Hsp20 [Macrophomina phaseolina MS6]
MTRSTSATAAATASHKNTSSSSPTRPTSAQQSQLHRILKTIDPYGAHAHALAIQQRLRSRRREALAPDFDVRETASAFYLEGELPGVRDRDAVRLDWIDRRTLSVEATIERVDLEVEWGLLRPIRVEMKKSPPSSEASSISSTISCASSMSSSASSASSGVSEHGGEDGMLVDEEKQRDEDAGSGKGSIEAQPSKPEVREWLSERRVGHYQRTFTFPTDVDASAIRARLGQGLLRVLVPKVVRAGARAKQVDIEDCE